MCPFCKLVGFFGDDEAVEEVPKVLKVGHVAVRTDDRVVANRMWTLHALEACKRTVGG